MCLKPNDARIGSLKESMSGSPQKVKTCLINEVSKSVNLSQKRIREYEKEGFIKPLLFSAGYLGLMGIVAGIRKKALEKELRKEGLIPEEFDKVLKAKEKDDD